MSNPPIIQEDVILELVARLQYVLDLWDAREPFADGGFTFPDGDFWPTSRYTKELGEILSASGTV